LQAVKMKLIEEYNHRSSANAVNPRRNVLHWSAKRIEDAECYFCKEKGHIKPFFKKFIEWKNKNGLTKIARFKEWYKYVSLKTKSFQEWCIDSGATKHICGQREMLSDFN